MYSKKPSQKIKNITSSPILFVLLCFSYPLTFLIQVNSHLYLLKQIIFTLVFMFIIFLIVTFILSIVIYYIVKIITFILEYFGISRDNEHSSKLYRALLGGLGTLIFTLLFHKTNVELIPMFSTFHWIAIYFIISIFIATLIYRYKAKIFNIILGILIIVNIAVIFLQTLKYNSTTHTAKNIEQNIIFKQKPNVYLVILESYASLDNREKTYSINNDSLKKELHNKRYTTYKTYANYITTLPSVASIFMMNHHHYKLSRGNEDGYYRHIIGGANGNNVINTFLSNGYRIDFKRMTPYIYIPSTSIETDLNVPLLQPIEVINGFLNLPNRSYGVFSYNIRLYNKLLYLPELILNMPIKKEIVPLKNDLRPVFHVIYAGAQHGPNSIDLYPKEIKTLDGARRMPLWKLNRINNYWIKTYKQIVVQSDNSLITLIRKIDEENPDAVVVLIGDHGPLLDRNSWMGADNDLNKNMLENGFQPSEVTSDLFQVFLAIKWPKNIAFVDNYISHVNLFHFIFAALANEPSLIESRVSDDSFILTKNNQLGGDNKVYLTIKAGKVLDRWETYDVKN